MSNKAHNDDFFRQQMEDYREMPSDGVWTGVKQALGKEKKKKRILFWLWSSGLGAAAMFIISLLVVSTMDSTQNVPVNGVQSTPNDITNPQTAKDVDTRAATDGAANRSMAANTQIEHKSENKGTVNSQTTPLTAQKKKVISSHNKGQSVRNASIPAPQEKSTTQTQEKNVNFTNEHLAKIEYVSVTKFSNVFGIAPVIPFNKMETPVDNTIYGEDKFVPQHTLAIGAYGYGGGVAYQRKPLQNVDSVANATGSPNGKKRFGVYSGAAIKLQYTFKNGLYINAGIGYENQYFTSREQFTIPVPGIGSGSLDTITNETENSFTTTSFGDVALPLNQEDMLLANQSLQGKLVYQNHHLFIPIDIGYRFSHKNWGFGLGASGAFHMPIHQSAYFYPDNGERRIISLSKQAPVNFSVGFEPSIEYRPHQLVALVAGGSFRYHVLNAYRSNSNFVRPYTLSGQLGIRINLLSR